MSNLQHPPIIIVAAGRSGTKMLRGILASHPDLVCFPREINYIWRHGNALHPTDEFTVEHANPRIKKYIHRRFKDFETRQVIDDVHLVEKTCANSLRVDFVNAIFPDAYIIHLIRDGRAVSESAKRRWTAPPETGYLMEKARWLPWSDIPYYVWRYAKYQLGRFRNPDGAQSSWGPRFEGLDQLVKEKSLIEACGIQWKKCVETASEQMKHLPASQSITIRYEDLVQNPEIETEKLFERLNLDFRPETRAYIQETITQDNLFKWQQTVDEKELELLMPHIQGALQNYGYGNE